MNSQDKAKLRRAMGEAAILPPEDQERRSIEAQIAKAGPWAEKEWLGILEEDEHLRLELMRVDPPAGLEERLLKIPNTIGQPLYPSTFKWWAAAASVFLALVGLLLLYAWKAPRTDSQVVTLAALAIENHMRNQTLTVETNDIDLLQKKLTHQVPFPVIVPEMGPGFSLIGGRNCKLCKYPAAYSLWSTPQGKSALFQLRASDFGLPPNMKKDIRCYKNLVRPGDPCDTVIWTIDGRGYALLTYHGTGADLVTVASVLPFNINDR